MTAEHKLTPGQQRLWDKLKDGKPHVFNARARKPIERLEKLGLVTVDWDADLDSQKGRLRWRITVTREALTEQRHETERDA